MICNQCGCKVPDGIGRCRVCGSNDLVVSRGVPAMNPAFSRAADLGPGPSRVPGAYSVGGPRQCPACGRMLAVGARFCNGCGTNVTAVAAPVPSVARCGTCGRPLAPGARFCNGCGARVLTPVPVAAPAPVVEIPPVVIPAPAVEPTPVMPEPPVSAYAPPVVADVVPEPEAAPALEPPVITFVPPVVPEVEPEPEMVPVAEEPVEEPVIAEEPTKNCLVCGQSLPVEAKFCRHCGASWMNVPEAAPAAEPVPDEVPVIPEVAVKLCPVCGKELRAGAKFCNVCGANVEDAPVAVAEETVPVTRQCHICGKELAVGVRFCSSCGADMESTPAVKVTDPIVSAEKKPKKIKKEKPAGKKSKKGLIIGIVIALVVALAAASVAVCLIDPFNWFESAEEKAETEKQGAGDVALEMMEKLFNADATGVFATCHDDVVAWICEEDGIPRDIMEEAFRNHISENNRFTSTAFEVSTVEALDEDDFDDLKQTYAGNYDLELEDAREAIIDGTFVLGEGDNAETEKKEFTVIVVKIDGKWYCDPVETDLGL